MKIILGIIFVFPGMFLMPDIAGNIFLYAGGEARSFGHICVVFAGLIGTIAFGMTLLHDA